MAVQLSYPGVYVQEVPSGVRTITGVATSITGFIGRTVRGEPNRAVVVNSFGGFEREFGGLADYSSVGFAVRDFFLNGGGQAVVVRLYRPQPAGDAGTTEYTVGALRFVARDPGTFGRNVRIAVDTNIPAGMGAQLGLDPTKLFNLTVRDLSAGGTAESYTNLTVENSPRRVDRVLEARSSLIRWRGAAPTTGTAVAAAKDAVSTAEDNLEAARKAQPFVEANVSSARTALDTAIAGLRGGDGQAITAAEFNPPNGERDKLGLYAFDQVDLLNLLVVPPFDLAADNPPNLVALGAMYCERRRAVLLVDPPVAWTNPAAAVAGMAATPDPVGTRSDHAALYFPRLRQPNPFRGDALEDFPPSGAVAGVIARTDTERGVWKAPAGLDAVLNGVPALSYDLTDAENGRLNPLGVNALRTKQPVGRVVYGARTLAGDDRLASEYKYLPIRRLALYIEESAYRGTQWAVFEPNDEPLWSQLRLNLGAFMHDLFRKGAFQGSTPRDAYFVKCDGETTTQNDVNLGIVNIVIGFAPLRPAEFVVISVRQMAGRLEV